MYEDTIPLHCSTGSLLAVSSSNRPHKQRCPSQWRQWHWQCHPAAGRLLEDRTADSTQLEEEDQHTPYVQQTIKHPIPEAPLQEVAQRCWLHLFCIKSCLLLVTKGSCLNHCFVCRRTIGLVSPHSFLQLGEFACECLNLCCQFWIPFLSVPQCFWPGRHWHREKP